METIDVTLSGKSITYISSLEIANAGEHLSSELVFTFDTSEWDSLIKQVVFYNANKLKLEPVPVIGGKVLVPALAVIKEGFLHFTVEGSRVENEVITYVQNSGLQRMTVRPSLSSAGGADIPEYENIKTLANTAISECMTATTEALTARDGAIAAAASCTDAEQATRDAEVVREANEEAREEAETLRAGFYAGFNSRLDDMSFPYAKPISELLSVVFTSGYVWGGVINQSSSYYYTNKIAVVEGDVITGLYFGNLIPLRFVQAYSGNTVDVPHSTSVEAYSYTVPVGVDGVIVSVYSAGIADKKMYKKTTTPAYLPKIDRKNFCFLSSADALAANTDITAATRVDNKKNCSYLFTGFFASFGTLKIGHGKTEYGGVYLTIDATNIISYAYNGTVYQTFPHGLTFHDFISVNIKVADDFGARAIVTVRTNGGEFVVSNVIFFGSNGNVYANSTTTMTKVKFQYVVADMKRDVFIFGDSYVSLADNAKWPYYLLTNGYTNFLLNGFGGATSLDALTAFNNIVTVQRPKYLVWLMGMNDPDTTVINANWKSVVDTVVAYCNNYGITPILSTIPNTPVMKNTLKNAYVRASGYRYVDFAKAVNAEEAGAVWYAGMLYTDNVHPDIPGAKSLASRILLDVPELVAAQ